MIKAKADLNPIQEEPGALECAVEGSYLDCVKALVSAGANLNPRKGSSGLGIAAQKGFLDIVKVLIEAKADVNHLDTEG